MNKTIKSNLTLYTPLGMVIVPVQIAYTDNEDDFHPLSEIRIVYNGCEYIGNGKDFLWVDTFADLQKKLPQDVKLACCMTCRHGNMCPFGNPPNYLFCTKDIVISSKSDMCDVFDDDNYDERMVEYCNYCHDFVHQTHDYYVYNDYLYHF